MISEVDMLARFEQVKKLKGDDWLVTCPAHADRTPSLHLTRKDERWLLCCLAKCSIDDVMAAARLEWADLGDERPRADRGREIVATYDYADERGELLYQVVRYKPKGFAQRKPDGRGGWTWKLGDTPRVLYRLPTIKDAAQKGAAVYVAEGEKDVHALARAGAVATTCPGGSGKWRREYGEALVGAHVVVITDRDEPGRAHPQQVASSVEKFARSVQTAAYAG